MPVKDGNQASCRVVSAFPGRIRLQYIGRTGRERWLPSCAEQLSAHEAVLEVRLAVDAGSLIVLYRPSRRSLPAMLRDVEAAARAQVESAATAYGPLRNGPAASSRGGFTPHPVPDTGALPAASPRGSSASAAPGAAQSAARKNGKDAKTSHRISVLHSIPGRLRVHIPPLRYREEMAEGLEHGLRERRGIQHIEARPDSASLVVHYDPGVHRPSSVFRLIARLLRGLTKSPPERAEPVYARDILEEPSSGLRPLLFPSAALALALMGFPPLLTGAALAVAALPVASRALEGVRVRKTNVDQLDLAALTLLASAGDYVTGGLMTWLIGLGDLIRARTMRRSGKAISELMSPASQYAWIERQGSLVSVPVDTLSPGDVVQVYPGDQIPVDGEVTGGRALVDLKVLTGESAPVMRQSGDPVFALTTVVDGRLSIRVEQIGHATRAGRVVALIEEAPLSDTRVQNYAAKVGDRLAGPIFALGGAVYLLTGDLMRTAAILILDFATGIRVSAPTTILSAMMGAVRQGLLIKGGRAMERLAQIDAVVFDKTGTLTRGEPFVAEFYSADPALPPEEVLRLAACAEANLKHPAAQAIVEAARNRGLTVTAPGQMDYTLGMGVQTVIEGRIVQVGNERYMRVLDVDTAPVDALARQAEAAAQSLAYVALNGRVAGLLTYSDPPRLESGPVIQALRDRGVKRIVMLTGDNLRAAVAVARELGITDVIADAFPEQKAEVVQQLRDQGYTVAVIGDGVNDSPAFTRADVGISLPHGADVARETADVLLVDGSLWGLPRAIDISRNAMGILKQNLNLIVGPTAVGLAGSVVGLATPLISTVINNGTTVLAGLNALRPLMARDRADVPERSPADKNAAESGLHRNPGAPRESQTSLAERKAAAGSRNGAVRGERGSSRKQRGAEAMTEASHGD